jgi:ubiquinone/menaquinone biosynthesis C-methylase UbiE
MKAFLSERRLNSMKKNFSPADAKKFYDSFGLKQDLQKFYENPAVDKLLAHADFEHAQNVFELGFGTGRIAEELLRDRLSTTCTYSGVDISATMADIARERLTPWRVRVSLKLSDGTGRIDAPDGAFDRFLSTYVLDLMSEDAVRGVLSEALRVLKPEGKLCLVSLTEGKGLWSGMVTAIWKSLYALQPTITGGCRPVELLDHITPEKWRIEYHDDISSFGITSEIVVAVPVR